METENREAQLEISEDTEPKKSILREVIEYIITLAIVAGIVFALNQFVIINARIPSESMENTIRKGDQIIGSRLHYLRTDPARYDIVIFKFPDDETQYFIKRIIGLPGETIRIEGGKVYADGVMLDDSFIAEDMWEEVAGTMLEYTVPEGCYFMLGDNRNHSRDSRYWENPYVAREKILGKAIFRYWPLSDISLLRYEGDGA